MPRNTDKDMEEAVQLLKQWNNLPPYDELVKANAQPNAFDYAKNAIKGEVEELKSNKISTLKINEFTIASPKRHIHLVWYDSSGGDKKPKTAHLVYASDEIAPPQVIAIYGRQGSRLRYDVKTKPNITGRIGAEMVLQAELTKYLNQGYQVVKDESFDITAFEENGVKFPSIYQPSAFAKNPVRFTKVHLGYDLSNYDLILLPNNSTRVVVLVAGTTQTFFDSHGSSFDASDELKYAMVDLSGNYAIDGYWNGHSYTAIDIFSDSNYAERRSMLKKYIEGNVDDNVVFVAHAGEAQHEKVEMLENAREENIRLAIGIAKIGSQRPGQNDASRVMMTFKPRAIVRVSAINEIGYDLSVDDGLGFLKVGIISHSDIEVGDSILVEYDSWPGYGENMVNPILVQKYFEPQDCSVEQLLAV
jgi:hypothetical protein